ncbi:unnamed protein product [Blepharisma stoltei]|uniref:DUF4378 domain-containing protein n=1 Tax=Blepharisma stoltei TaxID=1481888 RepID=A0AAU9IU53_9CILI|nr:unnamed protein product [Blepharisma stoltei]
MTQVISFSGEQTQLNSPVSFSGQSTGFLEISTTYRSFTGTRVGSASVTGKRILSQSTLYRPESDNLSKFPIPVQIFTKSKKPYKTLESQNDNSNLSQKFLSKSNTERKYLGKVKQTPPIHPSKTKLAKEATKMSKNLIMNRHLSQSKSQKKLFEVKTPFSKSFSTPEIKTKEVGIKPEIAKKIDENKPRAVTKIDDIVKKTLFQEKAKKVRKIKAEQELKAKTERRKIELKIQNNQIRQENSIKFRQEKFQPKIAWGANEKKVLGLDMVELQKEIEEQRKHKREIRAHTKSAEKDRIGLEFLEELKLEIGKEPRSKSVNQDMIIPFKAVKKSDPKIQAFIKVQKKSRKESKVQEMLHHQAEEAKRLTQLKQLDIFAKSQISQLKKKKKSKTNKKKNKKKSTKTWIEESPISEIEEQTFQPLTTRKLINEHSESKDSFQENLVSTISYKPKEDLKLQDSLKIYIASDTNLEEGEPSSNINFQDSSPTNNPKLLDSSLSNGKFISDSNISIEIRKNDIKKRIDDLKNRIGRVKENFKEPSPSSKNKAAAKIQSYVRKFLLLKRLEKETFTNEDNEVQQILSKEKKSKKNLEIQVEPSPYSSSETSSEIPAENLIDILSPKMSTAHLEDRLIEELKNIEEIKHQKDEYKDILKDQIIWQGNQKQNLQKLKEKELRELKEITEKSGLGKDIEKMLRKIIEDRYMHLGNLIEENIENVQEALTKDHEHISIHKENEEENMKEYTEDSSSGSSYFESQASDKFMEMFNKKKQKFSESESDSLRPVSYEKIFQDFWENKKSEESVEVLNIIGKSEENDEGGKNFSDVPSYLSNITAEQSEKINFPDFNQVANIETDEGDEIFKNLISDASFKGPENEPLKIEENKENSQIQKTSFECVNESVTSSIKKNESLSEIEAKSEEILKELDNAIDKILEFPSISTESPEFSKPNLPAVSPNMSEGPSITSFDLPVSSSSPHQGAIFIEEGKSTENSNPANNMTEEDSSLFDELQQLTTEPDNPIEKSPFQYKVSDSEDEKSKPTTPIPELQEEKPPSPKLTREITPELISRISESILEMLIRDEVIPQLSQSSQINFEELIKTDESFPEDLMIKTDSLSVQKYVEQIFNLGLHNIEDFLKNLTLPLKRNPLDALSRMQETEIGTHVEGEFIQPPPIFNVDYYLELEHQDLSFSKKNVSPSTLQLLSECEHIHNKMIFDATNESLQKHRPYGLKGVPMPWSSSNRLMVDMHKGLDVIIEEVKKETEKWSLLQAGKILTKDMFLTGGAFDEEFLQQTREEKLAMLLTDDLVEKDDVWVEYEFEETQVKLDLADMILEDLVIETFSILDDNY